MQKTKIKKSGKRLGSLYLGSSIPSWDGWDFDDETLEEKEQRINAIDYGYFDQPAVMNYELETKFRKLISNADDYRKLYGISENLNFLEDCFNDPFWAA